MTIALVLFPIRYFSDFWKQDIQILELFKKDKTKKEFMAKQVPSK